MKKVKRTHCYVQEPNTYDIVCPIKAEHKITWSEFEYHIWCYDCEKDIYLTKYTCGIFSGPIPSGLCKEFGISFDRRNLVDGSIVKCPNKDDKEQWEKFNNTWNKEAKGGNFDAKNR